MANSRPTLKPNVRTAETIGMRYAIFFTVICTLAGCAIGGMRSEWASRGYSAADIDRIHKYEDGYLNILGHGAAASTAFDSSAQVNSENRLRAIQCTCITKIGDRCSKKPDGLAGEELELWAKFNAADDALRSMATAQMPLMPSAPGMDVAECK